jgi:Uncharacterised protein conserved in bacteria (DUF2336)
MLARGLIKCVRLQSPLTLLLQGLSPGNRRKQEMLAALDALIQNGPMGRGPVVLRQLCALFLKVGIDGETSTTVLFDEVMANVAADLDDEAIAFLAPEMGQMAIVLPAFASTVSSRAHEIAARSSLSGLSTFSADAAANDIDVPDISFVPVAAIETPALEAVASEPEATAASADLATPVAPAAADASAERPITVSQGFRERRAAPRTPEDDAENPISLARKASASELLQIAGLPNLPEAITNVLISRGDRDALQRVLENPSAQFSKSSLTTLAELAPSDRMLKDALLSRADLPEAIVERLLPFLAPDIKAKALMTGAPFGQDEARGALSQSEADLVEAYRNGQQLLGIDSCLACVDEGKMSLSEVIVLLSRDIRVAELAAVAANRLDITQLCAFNILSGRLDHGAAALIRALDGDFSAMDAVMTMRRRCGCREAKETRSAFATAQHYTVEAAKDLIRRMDRVDLSVATRAIIAPYSTEDSAPADALLQAA